ncbi:uncharacterized protein I303_107322 [Kwoniella dejecticola CBS 10117]|uniref:Uncharacterized protein n=1 Tax=Kwoniella dejecticola CBS 10117 TaxID=1296121 RepID=A0A1A5ZZC9_9TREE|nr:uncharacterized protein I303_06725 [Kwoniella dejecticola CBS 10117]OBR83166.1 hypothetical protein I303_06725 [Kwoniella dejecticola CBS 10117]
MNQRRKRRSHATSSHSTQESHRSQSNSDSEDIRTDKQVTPWAETEYRQPYNAQYGFTDIPLPQDRWASITDRTGLSPRSDVVRVITTTFYCPDTDRDGTTCKPDVIMKLSVNGRNFNRLVIPTEAENEKEDEITLYEVVDRSPKLVLRYELSDAGLSTQEKPQWLGNLTIPQNVEAVAEGCSTPTKLEVAQSILQQASEWYDHRILDAEHHTNVRQYSGSQAQWNSFTDGGYDSNRPPHVSHTEHHSRRGRHWRDEYY